MKTQVIKMKTKTFVNTLIIAAFGYFATDAATAFDIVKDGKPVSEIVLAENANSSQKVAAGELKEFFEKISGSKVDIVSKPTGNFQNKIFVGESEFTKDLGFSLKGTEKGGYKLVVSKDYAIIAGRDRLSGYFDHRNPETKKRFQDRFGAPIGVPTPAGPTLFGVFFSDLNLHDNDDTGTWYAASELLEQLGCRWYSMSEFGTVVPRNKDLVLKEQSIMRIPHSLNREFYIYYASSSANSARWLHRMKCGNSQINHENHSITIILSKELANLYPQIIAKLKNGEPVPGMRGRLIPKLSDPKFRELSISYLRALFDTFPEMESAPLGPPDGWGETDYEDSLNYKKGDSFDSLFSNYVWDYWSWAAKELKKTHPDKFLDCMAYGRFADPPDDLSLIPDNIIITDCYWTSMMLDPIKRKWLLDKREKWLEILPPNRYRVWDYFLFYLPTYPRTPAIFTKVLQEEMQFLDGKYLGKFFEVHGDPPANVTCNGIMHFMIYWQSVLFWNPDADRESIMNEYFELYFGSAAKEMKEFYEFSEYAYSNPIPMHKHTVESLKAHNGKYFEFLAKARAKVEKDSVYDKRIAEIENDIKSIKEMYKSLLRTGPTITLIATPENMKLDANPEKHKYGWNTMRDLVTGDSILRNKTDVQISYVADLKMLYVMAVCHESKMKAIKAETVKNDDSSIFNDDVIEVYVNTPERSFFKVVVNSNGVIYDETTDPEIVQRDTLPILWNPGVTSLVKKLDDRWIVEISIPTKDFGNLGPTKEYPWGIQVGRTRMAEECPFTQAIAPTGGNYAVQNKWGNLRPYK